MLLPSTPGIQRLIADFLDRETHLIDALVEAKRRLMDLLAEKRTALITHAVTKGLDTVTSRCKTQTIDWIQLDCRHALADVRSWWITDCIRSDPRWRLRDLQFGQHVARATIGGD